VALQTAQMTPSAIRNQSEEPSDENTHDSDFTNYPMTLPAAAQTAGADDAAALALQDRDALQHQDYATAFAKLMPAAEAGKAEAQAMLAQIYASGTQGVAQDYAKALMWNEKAAIQGNARAHMNLGLMYRDGTGVPRDASRSLAEFTTAANMGGIKASRYLGLFAEEVGDFAKAASFYQDGADRGDITSQFYLGRAYELGRGVSQDYALAFKWYSKSSERGDHVASDGVVGLAGLYEHGLGVPQDLNRAVALFKQAAATGNDAAKNALLRLNAN
jgi:uncharacterized protein